MNLSRILLAVPFLALACGGSEPPPATPSSAPATETTTTTSTSTTTATPAPSASATAPTVGQTTCTAADVKGSADKNACMAKCASLSDKAPEGTRCMPPKTECQMSCDQMFKK